MNAWIILLFLLMGNRGSDCGCQSSQNSCQNNNNNNNCGCGNRGRNNEGRGRSREQDCGCDDSRFEPRFDSRPFRDNRETCGCEEKED